jgi:hypothetical protein
MMRAHLLALFAALAVGTACQPPPPIDLGGSDTDASAPDPSVALVYPPINIGSWAIDADCHVRMPVAVDIDDFELVDFREAAEADMLSPTQGHWHVTFDLLDFYATVITQSIDVDFFNTANPGLAKGLASTGSTLLLGASLRHNDHSPIECARCDAQIELTLVDPTDCVAAE